MKFLFVMALAAFAYNAPAYAEYPSDCAAQDKNFVSKKMKDGTPGYCRKKTDKQVANEIKKEIAEEQQFQRDRMNHGHTTVIIDEPRVNARRPKTYMEAIEPGIVHREEIEPVVIITDEDGLDDIVSSTAPCKEWVKTKRRVKSTGKYGYYRTCADGDLNNNFGSAKKGEEHLLAEERDDDKDGVPNHLDCDDNENGLCDNVDNGRIVTSDDLGIKKQNYDSYGGYESHRSPDDFRIRQYQYQDNTIIVVPRRDLPVRHQKVDDAS